MSIHDIIGRSLIVILFILFLKSTDNQESNSKHDSTPTDHPNAMAILEEQIDCFLMQLEILSPESGSPLISVDEEEDLLPRERLLAMKIPIAIFSPLLDSLKETKPALYFALKQHPIVCSSSSKGRKKVYKSKSKKKREKDADRISKDERSAGGGRSSKISTAELSAEESKIHPRKWEIYRQYLALAVAKCIADGSLQSYLLAFYLLQTVVSSMELPGGRDLTDTLTIPIGNILGSLFDTSSSAPSVDNRGDFPNPFWRCLLNVRDIQTTHTVPISRANVASRGLMEECQQSDAGSVAGSNMAEHGTETASVIASEDDDITEEELLMQALALSLNPAGSAGIHINTS